VIPTTDQMPLGALMLLMSLLALIGLIRVYRKHDPSNDEMPLAI